MASRSPRPSRIDAAGRPQETDEAAIRNWLNVVHCLPENVAAVHSHRQPADSPTYRHEGASCFVLQRKIQDDDCIGARIVNE